MTDLLFSRKIFFHHSEEPLFKFLGTKPQIRKKPLKINKNSCSKIVFKIFSNPKIPDAQSTLKITVPYCSVFQAPKPHVNKVPHHPGGGGSLFLSGAVRDFYFDAVKTEPRNRRSLLHNP
jgi:hypothetical protein